MKKAIIIYFVLINMACFSQTNTFSKVYSPYGSIHSTSFVATGILKQGTNYILSMTGFDTASVTNVQSLYFAKVDSNGENFMIINKYIKTDTNYYTTWGGAFTGTHNEGFCFIGDIDSSYNDKPLHYFMLFDSSMSNTLTKIIPHDTIWEGVKGIKETHDHCFVIAGGRYNSNTQEDVLIMKTDSAGNQIWRKTFAIGEYSNGKEVEETPDHGFLICGYKGSSTTGQGGPILLKTDSAGNLKWIKYLGNPSQLDGAASFAFTKDSNYLVALGYSTSTIGNNDYWLGRLNVIKYSQDGTQIWNKMYDTIRYNYSVSKIQILPNNDFIVMGSSIAGLDTIFYGTFMFKFNVNGDSLWRKVYSYTNNYMDENYLYDNVLNSDGSITACGYVSGSTLIPSQQIWIMKTDSNGYSPACDYTGIKEPNMLLSKVEINVYPNPTKDQTTIVYPQLKEEGDIHIYNMLGLMVYEDKLAKGSSLTNLNIQNYKAGLYKVIVREKGMMIGEVSLIKN